MLDHAEDDVLERTIPFGLHHLLWRGQDREHEVLGWVLVFGDLCQVIYFLLTYRDRIIHRLTVEIDVPLSVLGIVDLVEHLPREVPMYLLLGILILFI